MVDMTQAAMDQINSLAHFGVMGMHWGVRKGTEKVQGDKWGVRKSGDGSIQARSTQSFSARRAQRWARGAETSAYHKVYRRAAGKIRKGTRLLNNDPRFKGQDFRKDSPTRKSYYSEYQKMVTDQLNAAAVFKGQSPNKKMELHFTFDMKTDSRPKATVRLTDTRNSRKDRKAAARGVRSFKHSDLGANELEVNLTWDDMGFITDMDMPEPSMAQDAMELVNSLAHFGKLGMRWGHRKNESSGSAHMLLDPATGEISKGVYQIGSTKDHVNAREAALNPMHGMTNKDLETVIKRMNLEKQYRELTAEKSNFDKGNAQVKKILTYTKTAQEVHALYNSPMGKSAAAILVGAMSKGKYKPRRAVTP